MCQGAALAPRESKRESKRPPREGAAAGVQAQAPGDQPWGRTKATTLDIEYLPMPTLRL